MCVLQDVDDKETAVVHQVTDPLSIIFRMQSEQAETSDVTATMDWNKRVSLYFAYCVDGGVLPADLNIHRLGRVTHIVLFGGSMSSRH